LPIAIAAPTPISALVHSSTLVTAGLYLIMRFSFIIYSSVSIIKILLILSIFTSFYAGLNAIFEIDMKKLIALSTLSHLGFIGMAFSCGLLYLSFFHLLVHALFKSVLFIAIGDIITNVFHSQDIRFLSSGYNYTPSSFFVIIVSFLNLLGFPSIRGFFSKDLVLESLNYTPSSFFVVCLVYFNLFFTYYYTFQLFYYSFRSLKFSPLTLVHPATFTHSFLLVAMGVFRV
jgi:NADH-ubiquinone oxidoreductase chain 5